MELRRIEEIIFDGISRTVDLYVPECRYLLQGSQLYIQRKGGGEAVQVVFLCRFAFRFQEKLVLCFICKRYDLCLDARTVARADVLICPLYNGESGRPSRRTA